MKKIFRNFLFIIAIASAIVVSFNVCYANFSPAVNYGVGSHPRLVFAADLNGDGDKDLAVANYGSNNVSILLNNGDGTFAAAVNYNVGTRPATVFAADLNGDGEKDLAVANYGSNNVSILLNNGDGTFAAAVNYSAGNGAWSISAVDLDGDGDKDLAVANYFSSSISILLNNGDGTFAAAVNYGIVDFPIALTSADLDGDGDIDLATANYDDNNTSVLLNNGDGTFAAAVDYSVGSHPPAIASADMDGDGDIDLATANYFSDSTSVLLNNGDGTFAAAVNYSVSGGGAWAVSAADMDGDGDQDLAVANYNNGTVSILLSTVNNPLPTLSSISPDSKMVGNPGFTMTVEGTDFVAGSIVRLNGSARATTVISSTELTAVILSSDMASAGTFDITVFNPAPGGGTSAAQIFTVSGGGGGLPSEAYNPPIPPPEGFGVLINNASLETDSQHVMLSLKGGPDTSRMVISNDYDLNAISSTGQIAYQSSYDWDICKRKNECPEGTYNVYARFYTRWGRWSETVSDNIVYKKQEQEKDVVPAEITKIRPANFTRDLKIGMTGEDVKELQIYLNNHGFILATEGPGSPGNETNYFGSLTQAALIKFQKANNISPAVGYFGPVTRGAVNKK